jgi:hypothetical protein
MSREQYPLGRLMFRHEGEFWNVYFGTDPSDAVQLGSIRMSLVMDNASAKDSFMKLFSEWHQRKIKDITGQTATMETQTAPEHERSGAA